MFKHKKSETAEKKEKKLIRKEPTVTIEDVMTVVKKYSDQFEESGRYFEKKERDDIDNVIATLYNDKKESEKRELADLMRDQEREKRKKELLQKCKD